MKLKCISEPRWFWYDWEGFYGHLCISNLYLRGENYNWFCSKSFINWLTNPSTLKRTVMYNKTYESEGLDNVTLKGNVAWYFALLCGKKNGNHKITSSTPGQCDQMNWAKKSPKVAPNVICTKYWVFCVVLWLLGSYTWSKCPLKLHKRFGSDQIVLAPPKIQTLLNIFTFLVILLHKNKN